MAGIIAAPGSPPPPADPAFFFDTRPAQKNAGCASQSHHIRITAA
jgi:hypothetical protein